MKIPSIISNNTTKFISGLGNNEDSLTAMVIKDWIGDGATVYTYKKEGGKDDAKEKAIEEFGTGAVWLFGIPTIKSAINKFVYPVFKLDPELDPRILDKKNEKKLSKVKNILSEKTGEVFDNQKKIFDSLQEPNKVLKRFTNEQMFKGLAVGKFLTATAISAVALAKIIKIKQKSTTERINKDLNNSLGENKKKANILLSNSVNKNETFSGFINQKKKANTPSFTGGLAEFMYNPIKNTMILDGVIASTRLAGARKGERKEVLMKEMFQVGFVYGLALPIQRGFEFVGKKINKPINLDYKVLSMKGLDKKIEESKQAIATLSSSDDKIKALSEIDIHNPLIEILDNDGAISTIKNKDGIIQGIDYRKVIDEKAISKTIDKLDEIKPKLGSIKAVKGYKIFASVANVLITAGVMGILQPKINIWMRKCLNDGDNRNPAIVEQERKMALNKA